jgi:hypothetical protein
VVARNTATGESRSFARNIVVGIQVPSYKTLLPLHSRAAN